MPRDPSDGLAIGCEGVLVRVEITGLVNEESISAQINNDPEH